jgi:hypothetical protein
LSTASEAGPAADAQAPVAPAPTEQLDPVVEAFDGVCRRLNGFDDSLSTEDIDGYLTAVAASWRAMGGMSACRNKALQRFPNELNCKKI